MRTPACPSARRLSTVPIMAAASLVVAAVAAAPAVAAPTCAFDPPTATVTVAVGNGETATIGRSGEAITLDGAPCGVATVSTTDAIIVNGTGIPAAVIIDLSSGAFAPGLTGETDGGNSEIEFTIVLPSGSPTVRIAGGSESNTIVAGAAGINLNAAETIGDPDVLIVGIPAVVLDGGPGNDVLSVAGGSGTGAPSTARLQGGVDDDLLLGAAGGNSMSGDDGADTVDYAAGTQLLNADLGTGLVQHSGGQVDQLTTVENLTGTPGADTIVGDGGPNVLRGGEGADSLVGKAGDDSLDGAGGDDTADFSASPSAVTVILSARTATGDGADTLASIENAIGSSGNDQLVGDDGANVLKGLDGNDLIDGAGGDDAIDGGSGIDTADFARSKAAVTVNLDKGTATGAGADTLASIENASGSDKADTLNGSGEANTLIGGRGADVLSGRGGGDDLKSGEGRDFVSGNKGDDDLLAGPGNDQLDGGKGNDVCRGGPDADSFVFCEVIDLN